MDMPSEFDRPTAAEIPDDEKIVIHFLSNPPKEGAEVCVCENLQCKAAFNPISAVSGWTTNRRDHTSNTFKGKFKSCASPQDP